MKKIISFFTILFLFANAAYAAPRHHKKSTSGQLQGRGEIAASVFDAVVDNSAQIENGIGFGVTGAYYVFDNLALGGEFSMNSNKISTNGMNKVNYNMFGIYSKIITQPFYFGSAEWRAYALFGIGTYGMEIKSNGGKVDDRAFGFNYGMGLMHSFTNNIFPNMEIREHHGFQEDFSQQGNQAFGKAVYTNYGFNIGYRF